MSLTLQNIIVPNENSLAPEWISYYKELNQKFDRNDTNRNFIKTWQHSGNQDLTSDTSFVEFFKDKGMDFGDTIYEIKSIGSDIIDTGGKILGLPKKISIIIGLIITTLFVGAVARSVYKTVTKK